MTKTKRTGPPVGLPSEAGVVGVISTPSSGGPAVRAEEGYFESKMMSGIIFDAAEHRKFVQSVEKHVRTSEEYSQYVSYIAGVLGLNRCSFLNGVDGKNADVEMHHHPFTLFDVVSLVAAEACSKGGGYSTFSVAKEVLNLHYRNMVGVVPLAVTTHELAHAGAVTVGPGQVFGDVQGFVERFERFMQPELVEKWNAFVSAPEGGCDRLGVLTAIAPSAEKKKGGE
mgnify:CR=1 FL=1